MNDVVAQQAQEEFMVRTINVLLVDDEAVDQVVDLHGGHADQVEPVQMAEHIREQTAGLGHQRDFFRALGHG